MSSDGKHEAAEESLKTKPTKAIVGTVLAAVATGATAASTTLPEPWNGYITGGVVILGVVATWFGIYLPTNRPR